MTAEKTHQPTCERERPEEWKHLVPGAQFMDRILPAPLHDALEADTWGADAVRPRDIHNGIEDPDWSYWGGKPVLGPDGKYHWFGCRWPEGHPKGHMGWPESVIVRAVSDHPTGPFIYQREIGPGHFPEITQLPDGGWALFHFEGYYAAGSLFGPWHHVTREEAGFPGVQMGSVCVREDGSLLMLDRASRVWVKAKGAAAFERMTQARIVPTHMPGDYEDPVVWRTPVQYHMLVNDWRGRLAYHMRSKDGIDWVCDPGLAYTIGIDGYDDGTRVDWFKYERPKVLQDEHGRATHLYLAVIDVQKREDLSGDTHSSKNIVLPLVVPRMLQVLNTSPITAETREIRVRVSAEDGFDPHADIDLKSLRFGAPDVVDVGGGSSIRGSERDGKNLILIFDGEGNGISDKDFAGKLLGRTSADTVLLGEARLPE